MRRWSGVSLKWCVKGALSRFPALWLFVQRLRQRSAPRRNILARNTDIVIEGFPRSANSWTVRVFVKWQRGQVRVAHHQHSEAHVVEASRRGVPVLVLVRDPRDTLRSLCQMLPGLDPSLALRRWMAFHLTVERLAEHVTIATFDQVTTDLGSVVDRINARFDTRFVGGQIDEETFRRVTARMSVNGRPDPERRDRLRDVAPDFDPVDLVRAERLFARMSSLAGNTA